MRRVHGVVAAVVEEVADVMGAEHFDKPLVLGQVVLDGLELVTGRAEGAARAVAKCCDVACRLAVRVDHVLNEGPDDPVAPRVDVGELDLVLASGIDHAAG